jgi:phosphoglycolate phosphatase-like HAD superfamily hydrolase
MPIEHARIRALCFDVDGTLSDTDDQFVMNLARWLMPIHNIYGKFDVNRFARRVVMQTEGPGNWAYSLADKLGLDSKLAAMGDFLYRLGIGRSAKPFRLVQGVEKMLPKLHRLYPLSIISIRGWRTMSQFLNQFNLAQYFTAIVTGQTCQHTKPYPDPILWAAVKMGVTPSACLMVGDTVPDIQSGKRAGAQTVGVLCGFGEKQELEKAGADLILKSTADLANVLLIN